MYGTFLILPHFLHFYAMGKIFLLGFMGSGKSTIGKSFAKKQNVPFYDLDDYIVKVENRSIAEIFEQDGEEGFRQVEHNRLKELCELPEDCLISLGGGTPCFKDNMKYLKGQGKSVYLQTDTEILVGRLAQNNAKRPLVAGKSKEEIRHVVQHLLNQRESFYLQADFILENSGGTVEANRRLGMLDFG